MSTNDYTELGRQAFRAGVSAPILDPAMRHVFEDAGPVGSAIPALRAWSKGWTAAYLAAPWDDEVPA